MTHITIPSNDSEQMLEPNSDRFYPFNQVLEHDRNNIQHTGNMNTTGVFPANVYFPPHAQVAPTPFLQARPVYPSNAQGMAAQDFTSRHPIIQEPTVNFYTMNTMTQASPTCPPNPTTFTQAHSTDQSMVASMYTGHRDPIQEPAFDLRPDTQVTSVNPARITQTYSVNQSMEALPYADHQATMRMHYSNAQPPPAYPVPQVAPVQAHLAPEYAAHNSSTNIYPDALVQNTQHHAYPAQYQRPYYSPPSPRSKASASIKSAISASTSVKNSPLSRIQFWRDDPALSVVELPVLEKFLLSTFVFSMNEFSNTSRAVGILCLKSAMDGYRAQYPLGRPLLFEHVRPYLLQMMANNITTTRSNHFMGLLPLASGQDDGGPSYNLRASADVTADVGLLTSQFRYLHATNGVTILFCQHPVFEKAVRIIYTKIKQAEAGCSNYSLAFGHSESGKVPMTVYAYAAVQLGLAILHQDPTKVTDRRLAHNKALISSTYGFVLSLTEDVQLMERRAYLNTAWGF